MPLENVSKRETTTARTLKMAGTLSSVQPQKRDDLGPAVGYRVKCSLGLALLCPYLRPLFLYPQN